MPKTFRQEIEEILNHPDSQVMIYSTWILDEIEQAVQELLERTKPSLVPKDHIMFHPKEDIAEVSNERGYNEGIERYHSNLLSEINGSPVKDS